MVVVKRHHDHRFRPKSLRRSRRDGAEADPFELEKVQHVEIMPPDSIYGLSALDAENQIVPLNRFQGMVTLIANVACL